MGAGKVYVIEVRKVQVRKVAEVIKIGGVIEKTKEQKKVIERDNRIEEPMISEDDSAWSGDERPFAKSGIILDFMQKLRIDF